MLVLFFLDRVFYPFFIKRKGQKKGRNTDTKDSRFCLFPLPVLIVFCTNFLINFFTVGAWLLLSLKKKTKQSKLERYYHIVTL
jgi:hypothetical protein